MKTLKIIFIAIFTITLGSCSEESIIEGMVPTKPVTLEINQEVLKGFQKNILINIEGKNYTLNANYYFQLSGNSEVRQLSFSYGNNTTPNYLIFKSIGGNIDKATEGQEINTLFTNQLLYSGLFLYSLNSVNNQNFTYYTINGVTMNNIHYIPFKTS